MKRLAITLVSILFCAISLQANDSLHIRSVGADIAWGQARSIAVNRGYAYIGTTGDKLHIVNLARPERPIEMTRFNLPGVVQVAFFESYAVAAQGENGWAVINIAAPQDPYVLTRVRGETVKSVVAHNGYVLAGTESGAFISYDMSNPFIPEERSRIERLSGVRRIVIRDTIAFLATVNGLVTIDIRDLASPQFLSRLTVRGGHTDLTLDGALAYMLDSPDTIRIINIADPADMRVIWNHHLFHSANRMLIEGRYIYLGQPGLNGFNILDRWDPDTPDTIGFYASCWGAAAMIVSDGNLWTAGRGLTSYSLAAPFAPEQIGHIGWSGNIVEMEVIDEHVHALTDDGLLLVDDITNPGDPRMTIGSAYYNDRWGDRPEYKYVEPYSFICGSGEISTVFFEDDSISIRPSHFALESETFEDFFCDVGKISVAAGGGGWFDLLYNPEEFSGELEFGERHSERWDVKSITGFQSPGIATVCRNERGDSVEVSLSDGEGSPCFILTPMSGRTILRSTESVMALAASNLYVLTPDEEQQLQRVGRYSPEAPIQDLSVDNTFAAVLEGSRRVSIINLTIPTNPYRTGYYIFSYDVSSVELRDNYLYVGGSTELRILDVTNCLGVESDVEPLPSEMALSAFPNPFNSTVTIDFSVGGQASLPVKLAIYDLSGRMVADLTSAVTALPVTAGNKDAVKHGGMTAEQTVIWDAGAIPAGVYLICLESGSEIRTIKTLLMK